ncbi:MAG: thioesterase family protein [Spirochaetales bacterium]
MTHTITVVVRSYECDSYNHVNNAVYLNYLEHARMQFLHAVGFDYKGIVAAGYHIYVTHIDIHYKASAVLDDELFIDITATKLKKLSGEFTQKVYKEDGTVCAEATVGWACVSSTTGRPCKMPESFIVDGLKPDLQSDT